MQTSSDNKGSTSRLQEQSWRVTPNPGPRAPWVRSVKALSCCNCAGGCFWGSQSPRRCHEVAHSKSHCTEAGRLWESYLWGEGEGMGWCSCQVACSALTVPAGSQSCPGQVAPVSARPWPSSCLLTKAKQLLLPATTSWLQGEVTPRMGLYPLPPPSPASALKSGRPGWSSSYQSQS